MTLTRITPDQMRSVTDNVNYFSGVRNYAANTTISNDCFFFPGTRITPAAGKTVTFTGNITAGPYQIFDLSAAGSAVAFEIGSVAYCMPEWWGVNGNVAPYDTAAVQAAFDAKYVTSTYSVPVVFSQDYYVTGVTMDQVRSCYWFNNFRLIGISASPGQGYVLGIHSIDSTIHDIYVDGNYNTNYTTGVLLFSNVSYATSNLKVYGFMIRSLISGMSYGTYEGSPPVAINNMSENFIHGLQFVGVERCFYMNQQNGRVWLDKAMLTVQKDGWGGTWNYATSYCLRNEATNGGSVFLHDCDIINSESATPTQGYGIKGKNIYTSGTCVWEVFGSNSITGDVVLNQTEDGGDNGSNGAYFTVEASSTGTMKMHNVKFLCPTDAGHDPLATGEMLVDASSAPNYSVELRDCYFQNYAWYSGIPAVGNKPLVRGCNVIMDNVLWSKTQAPAESGRYYQNPKESKLKGIDINAQDMAVPDQVTKGGWTWGGSGTGNFGYSNVNPPAAGRSFILIKADASGSSQITSPTGTNGFQLVPEMAYTVQMTVKQITATARLLVRIYFYDITGAASSTASSSIVDFTSALLDWTKVLARFTVPYDAYYGAINVYTEDTPGTGIAQIGICDIYLN